MFKTETINLLAIAKNLKEMINEFKITITNEGLKIEEIKKL
jgi:hypothetical protein